MIACRCNQTGALGLKDTVRQPIFPKTVFLCAFLFVAAAFSGVSGQTAADKTEVIEAIYLARADAEGGAGEPVEEFLVTDVPIFCVVELADGDPVTVTLNFVAANVPGVKKDSRVVTTAYTTKQGETRVNFSGRPHKLWVAGRYRADILVDGEVKKSVEFDIKQPASVPAASKFTQTRQPSRQARPRKKP